MTASYVHKFGGSSLANAECFTRVFNIISSMPEAAESFYVLSAMYGVTDRLVSCLNLARDGKDFQEVLQLLSKNHQDTLEKIAPSHAEEFRQNFQNDLNLLTQALSKVRGEKSYDESQFEYVTGFGEIWSTWMMYFYFQQQKISCSRLDAREFFIIRHSATGPNLIKDLSGAKLKNLLHKKKSGPCIVTGYVATTEDGKPTTLKRNGSDYSAALLGFLLEAKKITIWSDVDGCLSADPKLVPKAHLLSEISYHEAMEMAYFGSKVLHPKTMQPAMEKNIPIYLKNTFFPKRDGTRISKNPQAGGIGDNPVKALACMKSVSIINVEGAFMIGVPGIATRLFGALKEDEISVIMISQASSEYSISFAIKAEDGKRALQSATRAFKTEMELGHIPNITLEEKVGILALIGDGMSKVRGISGQFFKGLARAGVNIHMIAQGSSERNISVVVNEDDLQKGLRAAHACFHLSAQTLNIALIGPGLIGSTFIEQLREHRQELKEKFNIDLALQAICNSKKMLLADSCLENNSLQELNQKGTEVNFEKMLAHLEQDGNPHKVILDCTSSEDIPDHYQDWLSAGFHIITPNKKAPAGDLARLKKIEQEIQSSYRKTSKNGGRFFYYETTVGAGLPIISTLKDLLKTGDHVLEIEGVLSGTLSYLFNEYGPGKSFSKIILKAMELGYTEPDPRDDLSGMDVARKVIILAREMGLELNVSDVKIESLVPESLKSCSKEEFIRRLAEMDQPMEEKRLKAQNNKCQLRFVGKITGEGGISVGLKEYPPDHAFCRLKGSENCIAYRTKRYNQYPLVVQGPGAGAQVTAAGVFADLVKLAENLRADA